MTVPRHGFFSNASELKKNWFSCSSVYEALAICLTDKLLTGFYQWPQLHLLVLVYSKNYPDISLSGVVQTPVSKFKHLMRHDPLFCERLAEVIYRVTLESDLDMKEVFFPSSAYRLSYIVEMNAPAVIAKQLGIQIVRYLSSRGELPAKSLFGELNTTLPMLVIWRSSDHYQIQIHSPVLLQALSIKHSSDFSGIFPEQEADFLQRLTNKQNRALSHYQSLYQRLSHMLDSGQIEQTELATVYQTVRGLFMAEQLWQGADKPDDMLSVLAWMAVLEPRVEKHLFAGLKEPLLFGKSS